MPGSTTPLGSTITALLGPTNTGKTHRCVSRMLEYESGMIGLPLRLLAREVYERVAREAGIERVAFITGEERRVPRGARYWVCTTEAMPVERDVDFLAVDEIQLAASPTRGHVFTERLLHARGRFETWFLGAESMRSIVSELLPTAQFRRAERLSKLSFTGAVPLGKLPSRAAVVAFSTPKVYEIAERLRVRKGGVAVVLGALSPKTRNAQVAMYQAGEVDHLVATDAIGMGLNMSLSHVALSALHKFDGRVQRALSDSELAQIAGRAGRSTRDGTFGTLEPLHLNAHTAALIEHHVFPPIQQLTWRNNDLDFASLNALRESLFVAPKHGKLRLVQLADDSSALERLGMNAKVRQLTSRDSHVRLLWDVCQIPDYRKLLPELHAGLLLDIYEQLVLSEGHLSNDWMAMKVNPLTAATSDLDTLLARLAAVRTWTYVSQRDDWVHDAKYWRERTQAVEEQLSDMLHERLIARFVVRTRNVHTRPTRDQNPTGLAKPRAPSHGEGPPSSQGLDPHHPFAALERLILAATPRAAQTDTAAAPSPSFELDADGTVLVDERKVGVLRRGTSLINPAVQLTTNDSGSNRAGLHTAALAATRRAIDELTHSLRTRESDTPAVRGLCYQLTANLGAVRREGTFDLVTQLTPIELARLKRLGIVVGERVVYSKALLHPRSAAFRRTLVTLYFESAGLDIDPHRVSQRREQQTKPPRSQEQAALALGFVPAGPLWLRCDALERAVALVKEPDTTASNLCSMLGCKRRELARVLRAMGLANSKFQLDDNP